MCALQLFHQDSLPEGLQVRETCLFTVFVVWPKTFFIFPCAEAYAVGPDFHALAPDTVQLDTEDFTETEEFVHLDVEPL